MKLVTREDGVDQTDASDEVNVTIAGTPFDSTDTSKKADGIYEKLAPNDIFIISRQGDTILYIVNRLGTAHLQQATLE